MTEGYRAILIQKARAHAEDIRRYDDDSRDLVDTLVEMANLLLEDAATESPVSIAELVPVSIGEFDEAVSTFKEAWHRADAAGLEGARVGLGVQALIAAGWRPKGSQDGSDE